MTRACCMGGTTGSKQAVGARQGGQRADVRSGALVSTYSNNVVSSPLEPRR